MSKSFCSCAVGLSLGLVLHGCGGGTPATTTPGANVGSSTNGRSTTGPGTTVTTTPAVVVPANVPESDITFVGRWYGGEGSKMSSWGQSIVTQFSQSTSVSVAMHKDSLCTECYFSYRVDNGNWTRVEGIEGTIQLATGLDPNSEHTVIFSRSTEPQDAGNFNFDHLELDEGFTAAQPPRKLRYQAIGDSITAGYKVECPALNDGGSSCDEGPASADSTGTYVRHLADAWGTNEWSTVAVSGVGLMPVMPRGILDYYKCREFMSYGDCQNPFDFSSEDGKPDVITVNIGTNDYALTPAPPNNEDFQSNYVNLVRFIQEQYPDAIIFCINPLQYTVAAPETGRNMWNDLHDNVKAAVDQIASDKVIHVSTGDPHSSNAALHQGSDYSDNTHPTATGHAKFATFLAEAMTPVIRQNFPDLLPPAEQAQPMIV